MQSFSILVIDAQPSMADRMTQAAKTSFPEACFTQVNCFDSAKEYLDKLTGRGPKLIMLHLDLNKDPTGLSTLGLLQNLLPERLLPVVVLSTSMTAFLVNQAYQLGASAFQQKPVDHTEWKTFLALARRYWYETVRLPNVRYYQRDYTPQN